MSNWSSVCDLVKQVTVKDSRGVSKIEETPRTVCCNVQSIGNVTYYTAVAAGIQPEAMLQIRKCDYDGERLVVWEGDRYSVTRINRTSPDFVVLTLTAKVGDRK